MRKDYRTTYYRPMLGKTFESALSPFVTREFPFLRGTMVINLFVKEMRKLVESYYPSPLYLKPGQMLWIGIDKNEKAGYKKPMSETKTKPVVLTILDREDILKYMNTTPRNKIRQDAWARLLLEADKQGAVLCEVDIAVIFKVSPALVSGGIRAYEKEHDTILPRRGATPPHPRSWWKCYS